MNELLGLVVGYIILAILLLWSFIKPNTSTLLKFILIPIIIWYGLVMYFIPPNLSGKPKIGDPPNNSIILYGWIVEKGSDTGLYLWVLDPTTKPKFTLDPREFFKHLFNNAPRSYRMELTEEMKKKWTEQNQEGSNKKGLLVFRKDRSREGRFERIDPSELLPKTKH